MASAPHDGPSGEDQSLSSHDFYLRITFQHWRPVRKSHSRNETELANKYHSEFYFSDHTSSPKLSTVTVFFLIPPRSSRVQVTMYLQTNQKTSTRLCSRYAIMNAERRENMSQVWESDEGVKGEINAWEVLHKREKRQKICKVEKCNDQLSTNVH